MWTPATRKQHIRKTNRYQSDLTESGRAIDSSPDQTSPDLVAEQARDGGLLLAEIGGEDGDQAWPIGCRGR